jgi:ADP-ribose pyrophosphatase
MTVKIEQKEVIRKGRVFDIMAEKVVLPNGNRLTMEIIRHPGAAAIIAMDEDRHILMLQQYRYAVGGLLWEIPAGTFENQESPLACAQRELAEETGYCALNWEFLGTITPVPGYSDEKIHIFLASTLESGRQELDPDEIIRVQKLPLKDVVDMISDGRISDAKTMAGLLLALPKLGHPLLARQ